MFPIWLEDPDWLIESWPLPVFSLLMALVITLCVSRPLNLQQKFLLMAGAVFALSLLGVVTGKIMGQSREAAVGTVMPAILTFLGGLLIYVLNKADERKQIMAIAVFIGFTLSLAVGIHWGATARTNAELNQLKNEEIAKFKGAVQKITNDERLERLKLDLKRKEKKKE